MSTNGIETRRNRTPVRAARIATGRTPTGRFTDDRFTDDRFTDDVTVTIEQAMTAREIDELFSIYEAAFGPLRVLAAARHVLSYAEFVEEVTSPLVSKIVARNRSGGVEGLMTATNHLETVPWISPDYYRHRYPDHAARSAIYYLGLALVRPSSQKSRVFHKMMQRTADRLVREHAILAFDICRFNDAGDGLADTVARQLESMAAISFDTIDVQSYYAVTFRGAS